MAKTILFEDGDQLQVACTHPTTPVSGDPVRYGQRPGVCIVSESADGLATVKFNGEASLSVKGIDQSGNSAVVEGDILYYTDADTPPVSKKNTGVRFGYAAGAVNSAATTTIPVIIGY